MTQNNLKLVVNGAIPHMLDMAPMWPQTASGGGWLFLDSSDNGVGYDKVVFMAHRLRRAGELKIVNSMNPVNPKTLALLSGDTERVVTNLMSLLPDSPSSPGADFYKNSAKHALTVVVDALQASAQRVTLRGLSERLQSADAIQQLLKQVPTASPAYKALADYDLTFKNSHGVDKLKQLNGNIAGRLAMLANGPTGALIDSATPDFQLDEVVWEYAMMYVRLPGTGAEAVSRAMSRIILADLAQVLAQPGLANGGMNPPFMQVELLADMAVQ